MKLLRSPWTRVPDDEYIAKLRRSIALLDRWRFQLILFHVGLLVVAFWVFSKVIPVLIAVAQPDNAPLALLGFVTGTVFGIGFGWMIYGIFHGLISMLGGFRAERLLLKLLDDQDSEQCESERHVQQESDFEELHERVSGW
jgi:hypothetical protein